MGTIPLPNGGSPGANNDSGFETSYDHLRLHSDRHAATLSQVTPEQSSDQQREDFFTSMKQSYADLRADEVAWEEYQNELSLWDVTLNDGLDDL